MRTIVISVATFLLCLAFVDFLGFDDYRKHLSIAQISNAMHWLHKYKIELKRGTNLLDYVQKSYDSEGTTLIADSFDYFNICIVENIDSKPRQRIMCSDCKNNRFCSDKKYGYLAILSDKQVTLNISKYTVFSDVFPNASQSDLDAIIESQGDISNIQKW